MFKKYSNRFNVLLRCHCIYNDIEYDFGCGGDDGCITNDSDFQRILTVPFSFESEELFEMYVATNDLNNSLHDQFDAWLHDNDYKGWFCDDAIEFVDCIKNIGIYTSYVDINT